MGSGVVEDCGHQWRRGTILDDGGHRSIMVPLLVVFLEGLEGLVVVMLDGGCMEGEMSFSGIVLVF